MSVSLFLWQSSAGATSISGNDDDNRTLTFSDAEYVDVYLNGSLLAKGDYTAASNTISGLAALASGDIVEVVVYDIFTVADTVSAKDGGTFSGNVTFSGDLAVGVASPETKVHIEGDVSGLNNGNVMHIESNGAGQIVELTSGKLVTAVRRPCSCKAITRSLRPTIGTSP